MTNIQSTSHNAYHGDVLPTLGERQQAVYEAFLNETNGMTNTELSTRLGWPINTVTPRVFELRKIGMLRESTKRSCTITGRRAIEWVVVNRKETLF